MFQAFQANVTAYLVSLVANRLGERLDLDRIWAHQYISSQLRQQLETWAVEVNRILHQSAGGRMVSEWAKKPDCWIEVQRATYSPPIDGIPEVR
jgi:AIPR protein